MLKLLIFGFGSGLAAFFLLSACFLFVTYEYLYLPTDSYIPATDNNDFIH